MTVTGVADNLSDGDQAYAIQLSGDSSPSDLRFANVDPEDVNGEKPRLSRPRAAFRRRRPSISGRITDENLKTATFTVSLKSAPSSDNVTITMKSSDTTEGVISTKSTGSPIYVASSDTGEGTTWSSRQRTGTRTRR